MDTKKWVTTEARDCRAVFPTGLVLGAVDKNGVGVWECNRDKGIVCWNHCMYEIFDKDWCSGPVDYPRDFQARLHPDDAAINNAILDAADKAGPGVPYQSTYRVLHRDGSVVQVLSSARFIRNADGTKSLLGICMDITHLGALMERRAAAAPAEQAAASPAPAPTPTTPAVAAAPVASPRAAAPGSDAASSSPGSDAASTSTQAGAVADQAAAAAAAPAQQQQQQPASRGDTNFNLGATRRFNFNGGEGNGARCDGAAAANVLGATLPYDAEVGGERPLAAQATPRQHLQPPRPSPPPLAAAGGDSAQLLGGHGNLAAAGSSGDGGEGMAGVAAPTPVQHGRWRIGPCIGRGAFSQVHLGLNTVTGELIAIKACKLLSTSTAATTTGATASRTSQLDALVREMHLMRHLRHRHIVPYLGAELHDPWVCMFQQWAPGGSVTALLARFGKFPEALVRRLAQQVLRGLVYLHAHGIAHRDLKGDNILLDSQGVAKIADFGTSAQLFDMLQGPGMLLGTPGFMAPEQLLRHSHGLPVDIYGFGCTVVQMLTGQPPWNERLRGKATLQELVQVMQEHGVPELPPEPTLSEPLRTLLFSCFAWQPEARPTAQTLLSSQYFAAAAAAATDATERTPLGAAAQFTSAGAVAGDGGGGNMDKLDTAHGGGGGGRTGSEGSAQLPPTLWSPPASDHSAAWRQQLERWLGGQAAVGEEQAHSLAAVLAGCGDESVWFSEAAAAMEHSGAGAAEHSTDDDCSSRSAAHAGAALSPVLDGTTVSDAKGSSVAGAGAGLGGPKRAAREKPSVSPYGALHAPAAPAAAVAPRSNPFALGAVRKPGMGAAAAAAAGGGRNPFAARIRGSDASPRSPSA